MKPEDHPWRLLLHSGFQAYVRLETLVLKFKPTMEKTAPLTIGQGARGFSTMILSRS